LEKTIDQTVSLKREREENRAGYDSEAISQVVLFSEIICPKIFKITYKKDGKNFGRENFKSSPESDC
jgi:hypothetical protein